MPRPLILQTRTERVQARRTAFRKTGQPLDIHRLKCVDASGSTLAMSHRSGRATPEQRVVARVPDNSGSNYTLRAALGLDGLDAPWIVDGAGNGAICRCWVSAVLLLE